MRKTFLLKPLLLLCALIVGGTSSVWADEVTYDFTKIDGFNTWATGYAEHVVEYSEATVTFTSANRQTGTITNQPVTKGQPVTLVMKGTKTISAVSFTCTQWTTKAQTITLHYSTDAGENYTSTDVTSTNFTISSTDLPSGTNAVKITFSSTANQVGIASATITYADGAAEPVKVATFSYEDHQGKGKIDSGSSYTMWGIDVSITNDMFYGSTVNPCAYFYGYGDIGTGTTLITPHNGATITKVEIATPDTDHNGWQIIGTEEPGEITASVGTVTANNEDKTKAGMTTWTGSASEQITLTNTRTIAWSSIKVYYTGGLPKCATPVISGETSFITNTTVTISCDTEGATIQYSTSTDGVNYTAYKNYTAPFQVSQTTTVKAKATKEGMVPSDEAYKAFVQHDVIPNIRYFISSHATTPFADPEYVQLENALVTYKNGNTAYLKDEYGAIMLFNCAGDLEAGDKLNGYMYVTGYNPSYNGLPEITAFELVEGYTKTTGNTVTPTVMTLSQLMDDPESSPYEMYLSQYVKIENATVISAFNNKNCTIEQGGKTIILRDNSGTMTSEVYDEVTVTGFVSIFNTTKQITVYEQSQIVNTEKVKVTIPESKLTTFVSTKAIDFSKSGITAYTAKVDGSSVKMTAIPGNIVPANTGVVLSAETAGKFTGDVTTGGSITGENELVGVTEDTEVAYNVGTKYNYILQDGAFYKATGAKLKAGKAYLSTTYDVSATPGARLNIVIDGETTGINTVQGSGLKVNGEVYDLQGRRIQKPTKGLYIVDGKKVLVK